MLMEGKDGLRDLAKEARDLGLIMSSKDAASAAVFGDTLDKLRMSLSAVYNKIGAALAPMLNRITNIIIGVSAAVTKWLDKNRGIIALVAPIVAALGSVGASAIGLGLAFKIAAIAVGPALVAAFIAVKTAIIAVVGVLAAVAIPALTGKVNNSTFKTFAAGEVLFLGSTGQRRGREDFEITYNFAASPNIASIVFTPNITVLNKEGWDYMWLYYADEVDDDAHRIVRRPRAAYVERVYERADFGLLGLSA